MKWFNPFSLMLSASMFFFVTANAQVAINSDGAKANTSAMLEVTSTSKGMLIPRMTEAQRTAISSPATGLLVYQTDGSSGFYFYNGADWVLLSSSTNTVTSVSANTPLSVSGTTTPTISLGTVPIANGGTGSTSIASGVVKSNGTVLSSGSVNLASEVTGTLPVANGGTGSTSIASGVVKSSGSALSSGNVNLTSEVSGTLPIANGGTGKTSFASGFIKSNGSSLSGGNSVALDGDVSGVLPIELGGTGQIDGYNLLPDQSSSSGYYLTTNGEYPYWTSVSAGGVSSISGSSNISAISSAGAYTISLTGAIPVSNGGTGITSYTTGDILYSSSSSALSKLNSVASGNALISNGVGAAPSWGKISLTSHVNGILSVTNGGTGVSSYTIGDLLYSNSTTTLGKLNSVTSGNALISNGVGVAPSWGKISLTSHVEGALPISNGGTGSTELTQDTLLYYDGTKIKASTLKYSKIDSVYSLTGSLAVSGYFARGFRSVTSSTAYLTSRDNIVLCNPSSAMSIYLPAASECSGHAIVIKNCTTTSVTVYTVSGYIDANTSFSIGSTSYKAAEFISDGSNWWVISNKN
jgi:hypothetical protein